MTSARRQWQQFCNIKLARWFSFILTLVWILHEIPAIVYSDHVIKAPNKISCSNVNLIYQQYVVYVYVLLLTGIIPIIINILFGSLAYYNVRQIPYRAVPVVRRELDKQLTSMVLVQVVYTVIVVVPFIVVVILMQSTNLSRDSDTAEAFNFAYTIVGNLFYMYFVGPFYIYIFTSKRFRQQFLYVIYHRYHQQNHQRIVIMQQIVPYV
ncbi:unnamed protein product [Adineta ricciae]|uniref:G-protein coupled receptors family 1 profile domain-containing protein n=1 Tax=Adineta ricciae TaxID=249248 RepID=A0A814E4E3_ADIRI|nr:unnamed protein product [Adineta ricciae]